MTWRLNGLVRESWVLGGRRSSARCGGCGWGFNRKNAVRARRLARQHTRDTGHPTRTSQVVVTEYRRVSDESEA